MDWRWLLLSLAAAAVAAVRLRHRPPPPEAPPRPPRTPRAQPGDTPRDQPGGQPGEQPGMPGGADPGVAPAQDAGDPVDRPDAVPLRDPLRDPLGEPGLDRALDQALDASLDRRVPSVGGGRSDANDRSAPGPDHPDHPDEADGAIGHDAVGAALERVWAEHVGEADTLMEARLRLLVHRGVPARAIRPAPGTRTVRVVFADGTVLLCRGSGQGDFGRLGLAMLHHSVRLGSFRRDADGTRLEFRWHPDQRLAAVAVGLDQPD